MDGKTRFHLGHGVASVPAEDLADYVLAARDSLDWFPGGPLLHVIDAAFIILPGENDEQE